MRTVCEQTVSNQPTQEGGAGKRVGWACNSEWALVRYVDLLGPADSIC